MDLSGCVAVQSGLCLCCLQATFQTFCVGLLWYAFLYVLSSFAIILKRKRAGCSLLSFGCLVTVNVL